MEEQIRARFTEFANAWNAHDVGAMVDCWTDGGNVTHPWGTFAAGREAITTLLTSEHDGPMRDSRWIVADLRIRPLSERTAVVQCDAVLEGVRAPNGKPYELPHQIDAVLAEEDGRGWRFVSLHPSFAHARG
ncbi:MAG TPA: SgcJ/EcaC family oxidoreductase [Thermoanaerobaculia bacterium]|nr:SgcJ/EcaC family oxidoreductase [Thermoanaerobaculia bacterium]